MYELKVDLSIEEHQKDLVFLGAAIEAAHKEGQLDDEAVGYVEKITSMVDEGDQHSDQQRKAERASVRTEAQLRMCENTQEYAVERLFKDTLSAADLEREAPMVQELFEGGVSVMMKPALKAQNEEVRTLVGKLETQDAYAGALRAEHVPQLNTTIDAADALLKERAQHERDREHHATKAREWKQRGNVLRSDIGGWLMQQAAARQLSGAKRFARDFFKR